MRTHPIVDVDGPDRLHGLLDQVGTQVGDEGGDGQHELADFFERPFGGEVLVLAEHGYQLKPGQFGKDLKF